MSDYVGRTLFKLFRRRPSILTFAGPLSLVVVILSWALLQALGFAFIYWAAFSANFELHTNSPSNALHAFLLNLYFSLEALTTLGFGDIMPKTDWVRMLVTFQALTGFALVTASVTWILLLYPALSRMRTLARRTSILLIAAEKTGIKLISSEAGYLLGDLALDVIRVRVDFVHFPIIYYFHSNHRRSSLSVALPVLLGFAEEGSKPDAPEQVRLAAATLQVALEDMAGILRDRFVRAGSDTPAAVFRVYAEDHISQHQRDD